MERKALKVSILFITVFYLIRNYQANCIECGNVKVARPQIRGGNATMRNEWPFIVALYEVRSTEYFCGGTLISHSHVLTAAHCIHRRHSSVKLLPEDVEVRLGVYNLNAENEEGAARRNVTAIYVNPDWKQNDDKYDADLAILLLSDNVTFNDYIQPICVPANDVVIEGALIDVKGTVVGWGLAEHETHEDIPKQIETTAINNSLCYTADPSIIKSSSNRAFCAKSKDGTPMKGDSGGGFFVISKSTWVQYGIVSALRSRATLTKSFAIYTNVKSFKRWIVRTVEQSGGELGESTMKVTLNCSYVRNPLVYICEFDEIEIRYEHNEVDYVTGLHAPGYQNDNVGYILFNTGSMFTLPDGLGKIFKNLMLLRIGNLSSYLGLKHIWRSSLKNMETLISLAVLGNDIEMLDENCLWDLHNLRRFIFVKNELKTIDEKFFERNRKLVMVKLTENKLESLPKNLFKQNSFLEIIVCDRNAIRLIDEQIFETNAYVTVVDLSSNQLEVLPRNLFKNNVLLQVVQLHNNFIREMDEQFFETNSKLQTLSLSFNKLEYLHRNLFRNNLLLDTVLLAANSLTTIDGRTFENNCKLAQIDLSSNQLEFLPENLFETNLWLEILNLSNTSLKTIDQRTFETNVNLKRVNLTLNKFQSLPRNLFKNNLLLETFDFNGNSLKEIDEQIFETNSNLQIVCLSSNQLEDLPVNLFKNNSLLKLVNFQNNSLRTIHERMFETNTEILIAFLGSNKLEFLPKKLFKNNFLLEIVDVSHNFLTSIEEEIFETNVHLKLVFLGSNRLESLPKNLFKSNRLLESVALSENSLKTIDEQTFETNTNLRTVFLSSNQLEYLRRNLFKNNPLLQEVHFRNNKLTVITTDFTELVNVKKIDFTDNTCITAAYDIVTDDGEDYDNHFKNLTEFQNVVWSSCLY